MRKTSLILLITILIFTFCFNVFAKSDAKPVPFKYELTPESQEWKNYEPLELKNMLNIPMENAQAMDTETLLNAVLDYPFLGDIYAFNDSIKAIDFLSEQFNGLKVLLDRNDLKDKLFEDYTNSSEKIIKDNKKIDSKDRFKQKYRESLFSHPKVFNKLSKEEKETIISKSKDVADKINTTPVTTEAPATFGLEAASDSVTITEAGDVIKYGTVYTPLLSKVEVFEREDMTSDDKASLDSYMASRYPNATKLGSATYKYNCHSYAWYSASTSNRWWMNDPSQYMNDGSYSEYTSPASGQKIYYPVPDNEHSGIITSVSGSSVKVTSKWGPYGLYSHASTYCPYFSMYKNTYWRR